MIPKVYTMLKSENDAINDSEGNTMLKSENDAINDSEGIYNVKE